MALPGSLISGDWRPGGWGRPEESRPLALRGTGSLEWAVAENEFVWMILSIVIVIMKTQTKESMQTCPQSHGNMTYSIYVYSIYTHTHTFLSLTGFHKYNA